MNANEAIKELEDIDNKDYYPSEEYYRHLQTKLLAKMLKILEGYER